MFEHRTKPLLPQAAFYRRMSVWLGTAIVLTLVSLFAGMAGYHWLEGQDWLESFLNAAMLLGGMGPVSDIVTPAGKLFAGLYAMYCGLFVIITGGLLLLPVFHRVLHRFHADGGD
jgi:hypothetical protein